MLTFPRCVCLYSGIICWMLLFQGTVVSWVRISSWDFVPVTQFSAFPTVTLFVFNMRLCVYAERWRESGGEGGGEGFDTRVAFPRPQPPGRAAPLPRRHHQRALRGRGSRSLSRRLRPPALPLVGRYNAGGRPLPSVPELPPRNCKSVSALVRDFKVL